MKYPSIQSETKCAYRPKMLMEARTHLWDTVEPTKVGHDVGWCKRTNALSSTKAHMSYVAKN